MGKSSEQILREMQERSLSWSDDEQTLDEYLQDVKKRVYNLSYTILNVQDYDICVDQLVALGLLDIDYLH